MEYRLYFEEINGQISYGIEVLRGKTPVKSIPDLSCDGESLKKLADTLNKLGAELSELDCIIEDYLTFFDV